MTQSFFSPCQLKRLYYLCSEIKLQIKKILHKHSDKTDSGCHLGKYKTSLTCVTDHTQITSKTTHAPQITAVTKAHTTHADITIMLNLQS